MDERLEEIKNRYVDSLFNDGYFNDTITITSKDYLSLMERAERVPYLEHDFKYYFEMALKTDKQNKRYREALENIANIDGYFIDKPFNMARALNLIDGEARQALESEE